VLAIFFVPVFFVFVMGLQEKVNAWAGKRQIHGHAADEGAV